MEASLLTSKGFIVFFTVVNLILLVYVICYGHSVYKEVTYDSKKVKTINNKSCLYCNYKLKDLDQEPCLSCKF